MLWTQSQLLKSSFFSGNRLHLLTCAVSPQDGILLLIPLRLSKKLLRMGVRTSAASWIADYSPRFVQLGSWLVGQVCHRELSWVHSCSLCLHRISSITLKHSTCRSSLMTPLLILGGTELEQRNREIIPALRYDAV